MRQVFTAILLFTLCGFAVKGEENTFAPLFTESTITVVQVNFADLSPENIQAYAVDAGTQFLDALGFDDKSKKETLREFSAELDKFVAQAEPLFTVLTQQLGITEFAVIADLKLLQQEVPAIIAVSWKDKTPEDVDAFDDFLKNVTRLLQGKDGEDIVMDDGEPFDEIVVTDNFILIPLVNSYMQSEAKETLQSWRANLKPSNEAKIATALAALPNNEVKIAVTIPDDARKILLAMPPNSDFPPELQGLLMFAQQKIEWANASFNILNETGSDVILTVKTATENDAVQMRALLEMGINLSMNMAQFMAAQDTSSNSPPPIFFTFLKGWLRTFLPEVEGDKLIFKNRMRLDKLKIQVVPAVIGVQAALLLPAIQAARRMGNNSATSSYLNEPDAPQRVVESPPSSSPKIVVALPEVKLTDEMAKTCKVNVGDFFPTKTASGDALFAPEGKIALVVLSSPPATPRAQLRLEEILQDIPALIAKISDEKNGEDENVARENCAAFFALVTAETQPLIELVVAREEASNEEVTPRIFLLDATGKIVWFDCEYSVATRDQLEQALRFLHDTTNSQTLRALGTCAGDEPVTYP